MRNDRKRHARPGEEMQHYYAMRTRQCRLVGRAICTAVTPVRISFKRHVVKIEGRPHIHGPTALSAFARRDGFENWAELIAFWREEHGAIISWSGMLLEWGDLL